MFKKNEAQDVKIEPETPVPASPSEEVSPDELGRLRDILFGSQSRTFEKRLSDLAVCRRDKSFCS